MDSSESGGEGGSSKSDKLDAIPQTVEEEFLQVSPPPSPSAPTIIAIEDPLHDALQDHTRLPSVLEAAIKAEPKVEVEPAPRIPTPTSGGEDGVQAR